METLKSYTPDFCLELQTHVHKYPWDTSVWVSCMDTGFHMSKPAIISQQNLFQFISQLIT